MPKATHDVQQLNQAIQTALRVRGGAQFGGTQYGQQGGFGQSGGGYARMGGDTGWEQQQQQLGDQLRERFRGLSLELTSPGPPNER